jgi:hypothetical protein
MYSYSTHTDSLIREKANSQSIENGGLGQARLERLADKSQCQMLWKASGLIIVHCRRLQATVNGFPQHRALARSDLAEAGRIFYLLLPLPKGNGNLAGDKLKPNDNSCLRELIRPREPLTVG